MLGFRLHALSYRLFDQIKYYTVAHHIQKEKARWGEREDSRSGEQEPTWECSTWWLLILRFWFFLSAFSNFDERKKEKTRFGFFSCNFLLLNWMIHIRVVGLKGKKQENNTRLGEMCVPRIFIKASMFILGTHIFFCYVSWNDNCDNSITTNRVANMYAFCNNEF